MLTDEELGALLHDAYDEAAARLSGQPAGLAAAVRRRHTVLRRRRVAASAAVPVAAAATVGGLAVWGGQQPTRPAPQAQPDGSAATSAVTSPVPAPGTVRLAGYTFTLPAAFHAETGSCTMALPDGTTRQGVPGADGGCAAIWESSQPPSWVRPVPVSNGQSVAWLSVDQGSQVTVTVGQGDRGGRYVVICSRAGSKQIAVNVMDLQKMLRDGLAAVDGH